MILPASPDVVAGFVAESQNAPEELSAIVNVMTAPPMPFLPPEVHGRLIVLGLLAYVGEPGEAERVLAPLRGLAKPLADMVGPIPYPDLYQPDDPDFHPATAIRTMFLDDVDEQAAAAIIEQVEASTAPMAVVQLRALGGAMARVPSNATAFAHRDKRIMANVVSMYTTADDRPESEQWVAGLASQLGPSDGAYVGFLGDEGAERVRAAYPEATWDRLATIKRRYDPDNLFRLNQNVPPA